MKRIVRTGATNLPPMADSYRHPEVPPVTVGHAIGSVIQVRTYSGVEISCKVLDMRQVKDGIRYEVKPVGDLKVRDFQKAGVPITQDNAQVQFVAFDWQIVSKAHI